jgi:ABC-type nitrate/sulfonate/bicarbonate transport system substrate-binding protein
LDLDLVRMEDHFDCIPDYYTPVLIASEETLRVRPEIARGFLAAVSRGYAFAEENPDEAAQILLTAAPELDHDVVLASQRWISPRYRAEAARWGEQSTERWQGYADWMEAEGILAGPLDAARAYSNEFLP